MNETTRHREAFDAYWSLGRKRSIAKLRDELIRRNGDAPTERTLFTWSSELSWQARIDRLERDARVADEKRFIAEHQEARRQHAKVGQFLQHRGVTMLEQMNSADVTPSVAVKMVQIGVEIEREARGLDVQTAEPEATKVLKEWHLIVDGPDGQKGFKYLDPRQNGVLYGAGPDDGESADGAAD